MNLIQIFTGEYPRSLWQLRQEHPNVSFPANPTDDDLAPFDHATVNPTPEPDHNHRTERVERGDPIQGSDGRWHQSWIVRNATDQEIDDYDRNNAPSPDWATFKSAVLHNSVVNRTVATALAGAAPVAAMALSSALEKAISGNFDEFAACWAALLAVAPVTPEELEGLTAIGRSCHLPQGFMAALGGGSTS